MDNSTTVRIANRKYHFPLIEGTEGEQAVDVRHLRAESGCITFDDGYGNTGSCLSDITFIDGEKGILRYRGYPIEQLAEHSTFLETAYLLIYGELPDQGQLNTFSEAVLSEAALHDRMQDFYHGFSQDAHPMVMLSAGLNALGSYYIKYGRNKREKELEAFDRIAALILSKTRTIAAMAHRMRQGLPFVYPKKKLSYCENFLHMLFSQPYDEYIAHEDVAKALDVILLLHADHEQNCSTSTVRMVASSGCNLFSSLSAGVCALWGPLHGGANMAVIRMLEAIREQGDNGDRFIEAAKSGEAKLMGFGHRIYKNYDPRAKIMKEMCERVLRVLTHAENDPLLDIARNLEEKALHDDYFIERKLYPNVDFYSGIILKAIGFPLNMFTVIFALGRTAGWISQWHEIAADPESRIHRPRQIYTGAKQRDYIPMDERV
tara:strand:+ start:5741 stop:7039 length:1299 start_codon:yes stop_codon:yes gene_type:complete